MTDNNSIDPIGELAQSLFKSLPVGLAIIDSETGEICHANDAYCAVIGRPRETVCGKTWMDFTHPDDLEKDHAAIRAIREQDDSHHVREKRYLKPDGNITYASVTLKSMAGTTSRKMHLSMVESAGKHRQERKKLMIDKQELQEALFPSLAILSEFRDRETGEHLLRTRAYVKLLLENLEEGKLFSKKAVAHISNSAMLHDIGKIGIPDHILLKPSKLTTEEFSVIKNHTTQGGKALRQIQNYLGSTSTFAFALEISESHHERWDGTGYPNGLTGAEIPLSARIMAIADVYDALVSERPYKPAYTHAEAVEIIRKSAGSHFDPSLVKVFLSVEKEFERTAMMSGEMLRAMELKDAD